MGGCGCMHHYRLHLSCGRTGTSLHWQVPEAEESETSFRSLTEDQRSKENYTSHVQNPLFSLFNWGTGRHLLAKPSDSLPYCESKGKVPLLSATALHHLHVFIFVLAAVHVTFCALTILFGGAQIRRWKQWEDSIAKNPQDALKNTFTHVQGHDFIKGRFLGIGKTSDLLSWLHSFVKQFYGSVTKSDYTTLRLGFITTHCRGNPKFNFHKYMVRALEADFKKVVGIRRSWSGGVASSSSQGTGCWFCKNRH